MVWPLRTTLPGSKKPLVKGPAGLEAGIELSEPQFPHHYNKTEAKQRSEGRKWI